MNNRLLEPLQSAYKAKQSSEAALIAVFNEILSELYKPDAAVLLGLLDMSVAFDIVIHTILLKWLDYTLGITGVALRWFRSYLMDRNLSVVIDKARSNPIALECSLPQGSENGPRSYSEYIRPLGNQLKVLAIRLHGYADDAHLMRAMSLKSQRAQLKSAEYLS